MNDTFRTPETADALAGLVSGESSRLIAEILDPVPNFWDVVDYGAAAGEIRYSRMIGWLLDPQEDHGLGASFAQSFVDAAFGADDAPTISPRAKVHPGEWRSIDILLVDYDEQGDPVRTLVIENKTDSVEHARSGLEVGQTTWYRWVVRGDFVRIREAIEVAPLTPERRTRLRRTVDAWETAADDYRRVPDTGHRFVYLTPRPGETAEDPEFRTVTYERMELLLDDALRTLAAQGRSDAEKIVRDFRRTIHRRFDTVLGRQILELYGGQSATPRATSGIAPEIAGLARSLGLIDPEHARRGDDEYLAAARGDENSVSDVLAALSGRTSRALDETALRRLVRHVWDRRPALFANDRSRFYWARQRDRKLSKIELLQRIAQAFVTERGIRSVAEFQRQFGAIVADVVGREEPNPFVDKAILYDPDVAFFTPSAERKYRAKEILQRDAIGPIHLDGGSYRVQWNLGCASARSAGRIIHLPVIRYFIDREDPRTYPITEAV